MTNKMGCSEFGIVHSRDYVQYLGLAIVAQSPWLQRVGPANKNRSD